jgi:MYXO-CTERM domain-containing protein
LENNMKKPLTTLALSAAFILAPVSAALATVDTAPPADTTVEQTDDSDNTGLWGLLGLLGLAGLAGLKRRNVVDEPRYERTRTTV